MKFRYLNSGKKISSFGFGLYKGEHSKRGDNQIIKSITYGLRKGINVIDTAQRYRNGRSEKIIKKVLKVFGNREKLVLISKAGLVPDYIKKKRILEKLKIKRSNCFLKNDFCIDPKYISWSVDNSLKLMNTNYIDFYLLHNPEISLMLKNGFRKIILALKILEEKRREKKINSYGISTWNGFRRYNNSKYQLNIKKIVENLEKEIGKDHGFRCIEAPISLGMPDLLSYKPIKGFQFNKFLKEKKINFFSSASLYEGNLENLKELNKIYNSAQTKKDLPNEIDKAKVSFPLSENSLRSLFILLENLRKSQILFENKNSNFNGFKNINAAGISFLKNIPFINAVLIGMEEKKLVDYNLREFDKKLNKQNINNLNKLWKKIKINL